MGYFAYCTKLNSDSMKRSVPGSRPITKARLPDYRLTFVFFARDADAGVCHLEQVAGTETLGVLWETNEQEQARDFPGYKTEHFRVYGEDGKQYQAWTRVVRKPLGYLRPAEEYFNRVLRGAVELGLPETYLEELNALYSSLPANLG